MSGTRGGFGKGKQRRDIGDRPYPPGPFALIPSWQRGTVKGDRLNGVKNVWMRIAGLCVLRST